MSDQVETYAGVWTPWWAGISPTAKSMEVLPGEVTAHDMIRAAGLDWTASKRRVVAEDLDGQLTVPVPAWEAITRDSDNAFLGMVTPTYHILQNAEMADWADAIIRSAGDALAVSAGSLLGGKRVWLQLKLGEQVLIDGDPSPLDMLFLVTTGHDGRHALGATVNPQRVVCANTLTMNLAGSKHTYYARHTSGMASRIEDAQQALGIAFKYVETYKEVAAKLMTVPLSPIEAIAFTEQLLPTNPTVEHAYRTEAQRKAILDLFTGSATLDGVGMNGYRMVQAVAEYTDHVQTFRATKLGSSDDKQALSIIEGGAIDLKTAAVKLLVPAAV